MAEQILSSGKIFGLNWDMTKNLVTLKTFKTIRIKKESREVKIEFLDENRKKCLLSLSDFISLCDMRDNILQVTSLLKGNEKTKNEEGSTELLLHSILKIEYAKALIGNLSVLESSNCYGCQMKLEEHHCPLVYPYSAEEKLHLWFEDLLALIDEYKVIREYTKISEAFTYIDRNALELFETKILDNEWRIEMKTAQWKKSLEETAIRLIKLEARFR